MRRPYPGPSLPAPGSRISGWLDPGSLIAPALCPGSAEQPSHPLEMSLETLSAARGPRRARRQPCGGGGGAAGKPERPPRGPWAASPGAASRPARPPARPPASPRPARSHRDAELSRAPAVRSPRPAPSPARGQITGRHTPPARPPTPRASHGPSSQRSPSAPLLRPRRCPSSSSGARLRGARPDRVTRADGTARASPCPPSPRARRGRARQQPRRDAPVSSRASAVPSTCSPGKVGAPEERRRGLQPGRDPHSKPGERGKPLLRGSWSQTRGEGNR